MQLINTGDQVSLEGVPSEAASLRMYINGLPAWSGPADVVDIPWSDVAWPPNALPSATLVLVIAYSADRIELDRQTLLATNIPPVTRTTAMRPASRSKAERNLRFVASAIHGDKERHHWRFHLTDLAIEPTRHHALFRLVFEEHLPTGITGLVSWYYRLDGDAASLLKRSKQTTSDLNSHVRDSTFLCTVCPSHLEAQYVECVVQLDGPIGSAMRYAVHAEVVANPSVMVPAGPPPSSTTVGLKRAVIIGVSKYTRRVRSDLEYCDAPDPTNQQRKGLGSEDATSWFNYLTPLGFNCVILGDEFNPGRSPFLNG